MTRQSNGINKAGLDRVTEPIFEGMNMNIVDRAKNILLTPASEWAVIAAETTSVQALFTRYAAILAALPLIGMVLFGAVLGMGMPIGVMAVVTMAVVTYVVGLTLLLVIGLIVNAVAPSFGGKSDMTQTMKLLVYSSTPTWLAALVSPIPFIGWLLALAAIVYAIYLVYLGVRPVMGVPDQKAIGFTAVTVLIYFVISFVIMGTIIGTVTASFMNAAMMRGAMM